MMRLRGVLAAAAATAALPATAEAVTGFGPEFRVSTTVSETESGRAGTDPHIAVDAATGQALVVWTSNQVADDDYEISAQRLGADGAEQGGDFVVSSLGASNQSPGSEVAADAEHHRFLVVYAGDDNDDNKRDIFGRLYDATGAPLTGQFRVPSHVYTGSEEAFVPRAAYNPVTDEWLVTWGDTRLGNANADIFARRLDVNGTPQATDVRVSQRATGCSFAAGASYSDVAATPAGGYLVIFSGTSCGAPDPENEIFEQLLTGAAAPTPNDNDVKITDTPGHLVGSGEPTLAFDPVSQKFLVAYASGRLGNGHTEVWRRLLDAGGAPLTPETQVSENGGGGMTFEPDAAGGGGRFLVEFLRMLTATTFAPFVQEVGSDGADIDGDTQLAPGQGLFGDVARSGDRWLGAYPVGVGTGHADVFARFSGAAVTTPPPPPPGPVTGQSPPPTTTPPVTLPAVQKLPSFNKVVTLPSAKSCVSRRRFRIRLRIPKGLDVVSAEVRVNNKRVKVVKGKRLTAPVDLRGLPKGRFTVKIIIKLADGRKIQGSRKYRTCARKRAGKHAPPV